MASRQQTLGMLVLIALALAVSSLTTMRFPGVPVGVSELILMGCMVAHIPLGLGIHGGNRPNKFVPFLFLLLVAMLPGYILTLTSLGEVDGALYNLIATVYVVLLFAYLHYGFDHRQFELDRLLQVFVVLSTLYFVIVLVLAAFEPSLVYKQDDIEDLLLTAGQADGDLQIRLVGFAENPNQISLHALVVLFFILRLRSHMGFMTTALCFLAAAAVGLMAQSDAFLFALVAMIGVSVVMGIVFSGSVITGLVVLVPAIVIGLLVLDPLMAEIQQIVNTQDQNRTRFALWENGILAALERPVVGLGPGAWSGFDGPMQLEEAHNSLIDYFSNAGVIGIILMLTGMVALIIRTMIARQAVLLAGIVGILVFALFHNVLRQPIMWLVLYYTAQQVGAVTSEKVRRRRGRPRQRRIPAHASRA